jgi:hypothetical protein
MMRSASASVVWVGISLGREERSRMPARPSVRYRAVQRLTILADTP